MDLEYVTVPVRGWAVEWCREVARAQAHVLTLSELLRGHLDDRGRALVAAGVIRRLRDGVAAYLEERDLVMLGASPIEELWTSGALVMRVRMVAIRRAPLPPVEDWPRVFAEPDAPSAVAP